MLKQTTEKRKGTQKKFNLHTLCSSLMKKIHGNVLSLLLKGEAWHLTN